MIIKMDITNRKTAEEVLSIQIPSYKIEANLIGSYDIPPLKDTIDTLQRCGECFYGYYSENKLCGALAMKIENEEMDIHRLIVDPDHFLKGIAQSLLSYAERQEGIKRIIVSTGSRNTPAVRFYEKNGFQKVKEVIVNEQISLTFFEKNV
ncbi:GNAT family N-acetyltransferase [Metabacillus indicus]|uniref:GNAT family N-acetyltransferase n=1 Tax=Metabacillus indicus TaxID=246786 RepID=UPI002A03E031|nr:GNAT family N-acetyltransferase [Metabacillus indicus]MDX8289633.1 GNAT family N-acetyltransferase [Metabacillus indicus]